MQRRTLKTITVAKAILDHPENQHIYGYPVAKHTGLRSGTVYPILHRFLDAGWLADGWDETRYPPRRYYTITDLGREEIPKWIGKTSVQH